MIEKLLYEVYLRASKLNKNGTFKVYLIYLCYTIGSLMYSSDTDKPVEENIGRVARSTNGHSGSIHKEVSERAWRRYGQSRE